VSNNILLRESSSAIRTDSTGRTIYGIGVPFGQIAVCDDGYGQYAERFEVGAFARTIAERGDKIRLFSVHSASRNLPLGRATELVEQPDGLHVAFALGETQDADEALSLVRDGIVDAFSIGFRPVAEHREGDVLVRTEVELIEVSLVGLPAYSGAVVAGVRSVGTPPLRVDLARRRLELILRKS
jgi:hypothetical protein